MTSGGLLGAVVLWLAAFHKNFFVSLSKTMRVTGYGIYTDFGEAIQTHFWYLLRAKLPGYKEPSRAALEQEVKETFLAEFFPSKDIKSLEESEKQVLITHSCRSIFYYVIRNLLEEAKEKKGEMKIKLALPAVHFGSFFKLLKGMEKGMNCVVEYYEIDLKEDGWTLDQDSIDEEEVKTCDMIICQHLFGVPFVQDKLFELGNKHSIPILEDCVQSGSLYGKYKGDARSDVVMYSGGLDKTPNCFGGGLGYFRNSHFGKHLYQKCSAYHETLPMDTWKARWTTCTNQMIHLVLAKNMFGILSLLGLVSYLSEPERGFINWYAMSLRVRQNKSITPFQHAESGFLRKPSVFQLQSMLYAMTIKRPQYARIAQREVEARDLLLSNIPKQYHTALFPWFTKELLYRHRENLGVSEFTWVVNPRGDRKELCDFLNNNFMITMINTTWEYEEKSNKKVSAHINNNLIYIPNINEMNDEQIRYVAATLTKFCEKRMKT